MVFGLPGADRRFTGSYEADSFAGNAFPTTSWVADDPRPLDPGSYRLTVEGNVERTLSLPLEDLDQGDELVATLDCTGGFTRSSDGAACASGAWLIARERVRARNTCESSQ